MNPTTIRAFREEMEGITKEASFLTNVGTRIGKTVKGMGQNAGNALKGFKNPVEGIKRGWHDGHWSMGDELGRRNIGTKMMRGEKLTLGDKFNLNFGRSIPGAKPLTLLGGALTAPEAFKKEDPTGEGRSRTSRTLKWVGNQAGGLIGAPFGFTGAIVGSMAGEGIGAIAGKGADMATKKLRRPAPAPTATTLPAAKPPTGVP